jgi:two-component system, LytTR family, response regulator
VRLERVLVVDDEAPARRYLARMLRELAEIDEVVQASGVAAAARLVESGARLDAIFLDVQMPIADGFALFERCAVTAPVVFVTAYHQHAVRAFEVNAVDYLLKPVSRERLAEALARLGARGVAAPASGPLGAGDVVLIRDRGRQRFVRLDELAWIAAADDYTEVQLAGGEVLLSALTMRDWEARLPAGADGFARIHRSTIVGLRHVLELRHTAAGAQLSVRGLAPALRVARTYLPALKGLIAPT